MSSFALAAAGLAAALVASLLVSWYRLASIDAGSGQRESLNIDLYGEHLAELEAALAGGQIDVDRFGQLKSELDRRLLADIPDEGGSRVGYADTRSSWIMVAGILALPLAALLLYQQLGAGSAIGVMTLLDALSEEPAGERRDAMVVELIDQLESTGVGKSEDGFRSMLANYYLSLGRAPEAVELLEQLSEHYPDDGELLGLLFRARYSVAEGQVGDDLRELARRALQLAPTQTGLLGVLGMESFRRGDYQSAVDYWVSLLAQLPSDSEQATLVRDGIDRARMQLGTAPPLQVEQAAEQIDPPQGVAVALAVSVSLDTAVEVDPADTVFVFARAVGGPPMPLAVARFRVDELPLQVTLDDSMAMSPAMRLSSFQQVRVVARISRHGGPEARIGDFEGQSGPLELAPGTQPVKVIIDREVVES